MIGWIARLCALCAMSTLVQMMLPQEKGKEGIRLLSGLMMIRMTCESAAHLLSQISSSTDLRQLFDCLIN